MKGHRSDGLWSAVEADFRHSCGAWGASRPALWRIGLLRCVVAPRIRAVLYYRLGHALWQRRGFRVAALLLQARAIGFSGAEIHPAAIIGPGFLLVHSQGVVIGHDVRIGRDVAIYHGVTLGHGADLRQPSVGDRVRIFAGAKVLGGITIGDGARVAANAVVVRDVLPNESVGGVPAKSLRTAGS